MDNWLIGASLVILILILWIFGRVGFKTLGESFHILDKLKSKTFMNIKYSLGNPLKIKYYRTIMRKIEKDCVHLAVTIDYRVPNENKVIDFLFIDHNGNYNGVICIGKEDKTLLRRDFNEEQILFVKSEFESKEEVNLELAKIDNFIDLLEGENATASKIVKFREDYRYMPERRKRTNAVMV